MYLYLFSFLYVVSSIVYVLNTDELKILEDYANGIEKYDKQKEKLVIQSISLLANDEEVIQITSLFTPFDNQQRVDILTKKAENIYTVYTLYYAKQQSSELKFEKVELKGVEKCTSLTYLQDQFIVDCTINTILFVLQNGTQIQYDYNKNVQFTQILGFYDGLLGLSPGYLSFFDEQLQLERQILANYIQVLKDEKNVYLLNELQVFQYTQDGGVIEYNHKCENKPEFMAVIDKTFYIQCGTLRTVSQNEVEVLSLKVSEIFATNQYIIINNTSIYNQDLDTCYYFSNGQLYPINYDDDVIQIVNKQIQIGSIKGYYLIQSDQISQFNLSLDQFYVVDKGLQVLNSGNSAYYGNKFQVVNYVSGPYVEIQQQGVLEQPLQLNLEKQIKDKQLLTLINYLDESIFLIYLQNAQLFSQKCLIDQLQLKCQKEMLFQQNSPSNIENVQGTVFGIQIILAYQSQETVYIYLDDKLLDQINNVTTFQLYQNYIVILKDNEVSINYIIDNKLNEEAQINITCIMVAIYFNEIALVDERNNLIIVSDSNSGWYYSFSQSFQDLITEINYVNSQLIVSTEKQAYIYESRILRGKLDLDIITNGSYLQTQTHLYIYNTTKIFQFQIFSDFSLSSWPQQIIKCQIQQRFLGLTFKQSELLLIDNILFVYSQILQFTPNNIVERDVYSRFSSADIIFSNYQNKSVTVKVKTIGNILKLQPLQYKESDCQINNDILQIDQASFFDGPISIISKDVDDGIEIIQRASKYQTQPSWIDEGLNDLIYIGNNLRVIYSNTSLSLCSENKCQSILNNTQDCLTLEQDQLQFYLVCKKFVYSGLKSKPESINNIDFTPYFNQLLSIKFDQGSKIGIISRSDIYTQFSLYNNYQLKVQKIISDLQDFQFNDSNIIFLTSQKVILVDSTLKEIHSYNLLENLISTEQNEALKFLKFKKICHYKENQYLISSKDGPIYLMYLNNEHSDLVLQFTNIQNTTPIETYLIQKDILVCIYKDDNDQYFAAFYDFEDRTKSSLIIPYFNVIELGSSFSKFHYTQQSDAKQIFVINDYLQIKSVSSNKYLHELIANDLKFQSTKINLKINLTETDETPENWTTAIYILCGILGILVFLILFRYIRRYWLTRNLKFEEDKPSEFKNEEV
ncbi:unnamed protein product (macronuclear) [Paramecium tetraurelia]|uniref:Transmembrane protein n=1 Tax=Paramecium tetraurelia TaxID=5888 RepID=A0BCE9_PARTE|nr:uncharacterized protein GSPATT00004310001 [Paramecium tetraurelia]CAK56216.1 unnamed protein product [Paramecium tetraurelia]|eukprot:XP_001423614.1 hypothetical protein (macronuclear) [Paramecium tetraurelia strain d4-2]